VEIEWTAGAWSYGLYGRAFASVAPDETRLLLPPDAYLQSGYTELSMADGRRLGGTETALLARDDAWRFDLVLTFDPVYGAEVVDRVTLDKRLDIPGPIAGAGLSADGRYAASLDCQARLLERYDLVTGDTRTVSLAELPDGCPSVYNGQASSITIVPGGEIALMPWSAPGVLAEVDFGQQKVQLHTLDRPDPAAQTYPPAYGMLAIEPSPSGASVAITAMLAPLRVFALGDLDRPLYEVETAETSAFQDCYCERRTFGPLAWSPDERWLATLDEGRQGVIRRSTDGAILATLPRGVPGAPNAERATSLFAFTPSGTGLVSIAYANDAAEDDVIFYRLSE
jgi:hypothetical protein